ncbi:MAG: hypothetical protein ACD_82C00181G0002 [uncultured bacterium]|jgi:hypothetical protein|nr:MAG: hypothetical protein ACD_82C00181G0002 [uncultured bacterium]KKP29754.1 MAG: hypothetical protein UR12_C0003G0028 [candidate division TM6 bacterium GW2011_GWF2_30_66]
MGYVMKIFKNLSKKALKFCIIAAIISSNKLLPMRMRNIDLRLNKKPANISVYDWSKQKAQELVNEKRHAILALLGRTDNGWEETKENLEPIYKKSADHYEKKYKKQILPPSSHGLIMSIIKHPMIQKELGITSISIKENIIIAERAYAYPIKFLCEDPDEPIDSPEASDGYNIIISPQMAFSGKYSDEELEAFIGHELAHIKYKHIPEIYCFTNLYREKLSRNETNVNQDTFDEALHAYNRAIEIQADIVGTFNNWIWLETVENYWQNQTEIINSRNMDPHSYELDIDHPPVAVRANYFNNMFSEIKRESEPKTILPRPNKHRPNKIKPIPVKNTPKTNNSKISKLTENITQENNDRSTVTNKKPTNKKNETKNLDNNQEQNNAPGELLQNLINNITTKQAFTVIGFFIAAYIIFK